MIANTRRFLVNEDGYVTDTLNPSNSRMTFCHRLRSDDDRSLREELVARFLRDYLEKLIINHRPKQKLPNGEEYQPHNEEVDVIWWPVLKVIQASHLNYFDPAISVQNKFNGTLKREKNGVQDFSSLSLFKDDVERLLRDLYGDTDSEELEVVLSAVFRIVEAFTTGSEWRRGMQAKSDLISRVCEVRANPSVFSEYTVRFADRFSQQWECSAETA
jgi:hypothetical protein